MSNKHLNLMENPPKGAPKKYKEINILDYVKNLVKAIDLFDEFDAIEYVLSPEDKEIFDKKIKYCKENIEEVIENTEYCSKDYEPPEEENNEQPN